MPSARTHKLAALLCGLVLPALLTSAQSPTAPSPAPAPSPTPTPSPATAQSPANAPLAARLNVLVLDKKNAPVEDLRAEDFQVLEDGVPQTITSVTHVETPVSYALVVDNTGSMRTQLDLLLRAGATVIAGNRPADETAVIRFVNSQNIQVIQHFTAEQPRLTNALTEMYIEGGQSAIIDAVYLAGVYVAAKSLPGAERRRALVLMTDGEDRASYFDQDVLLKFLRASDVQVFTIGFVQDLDKYQGLIRPSRRAQAVKLLDTLTEETGGRVFYPKTVEELRDAVAAIGRDLHTQYVIAYAPTNQARDGKYRKVQVKLSERPGAEKRTVITRAGYVVPKDPPADNKTLEQLLKRLP